MKESAFRLRERYGEQARRLAAEDPELERKLAEGVEGTLGLTEEGELDAGRPPATTETEAELLRTFAFEPGAALCLSGAGYRSMLFHAGALLRMNEAGLLPRLVRVTSVSASSITAALLGLKWQRLRFDAEGVAPELREELVEPLLELARTTVDGPLQTLTRRGRHLVRALEKGLFGTASLQDLPDNPRFLINATNLRSGAAWRFGKRYMGDHRAGRIPEPRVPLALAVAASAAGPIGAVRVDQALLVDGGIRDPLGLEAAYARFRTILVSDGGGDLRPQARARSPVWQVTRMIAILADQVRALYKRQLVNSYTSGLREGAYWSIRAQLPDYEGEAVLPYSPERTRRLAQLPLRLAALDERDREELVNWGYVVCDAALRRHLDPGLQAAGRLPFPQAAGALP